MNTMPCDDIVLDDYIQQLYNADSDEELQDVLLDTLVVLQRLSKALGTVLYRRLEKKFV